MEENFAQQEEVNPVTLVASIFAIWSADKAAHWALAALVAWAFVKPLNAAAGIFPIHSGVKLRKADEVNPASVDDVYSPHWGVSFPRTTAKKANASRSAVRTKHFIVDLRWFVFFNVVRSFICFKLLLFVSDQKEN